MNDKKQIEEIAKIINPNFGEDDTCEFLGKNTQTIDCFNFLIADELYNVYYRKINKDNVVLTMEEYEKLERINFQEGMAEGRKEVQDIYNSLREHYVELLKENAELESSNKIMLNRDFDLAIENERLYKRKLELENQLKQRGLTEYVGADEIRQQARKETAREILRKGHEYLMNSTDKAVAFACFLGMMEAEFGMEVKE